MSDISLPPEPLKPKKHFIDKPLVKFALTLSALSAPVPLLLVLINIWLSCQEAQKGVDPFSVFRRLIEGGGAPPLWLIPVAFIPSIVLLTVLFRNSRAKLLGVLLALVAAASAETALFLQMIQ